MKINNLTLFYVLAIFFSLSFASCGDDDEPGTDNVDCNSSISVNNAVAVEVEEISVALNAYVGDPSTENCNNLEQAYQDYIDALKSLQDCADQAGVGAEFMSSLTDAEASIGDLGC